MVEIEDFLDLETERFLAVRQIVDKLSMIIARIANNAQGGIRYFNEMPYFVAIHSRDCKVLTTNPTYKRRLGNKINKNSWDIYIGNEASKDTGIMKLICNIWLFAGLILFSNSSHAVETPRLFLDGNNRYQEENYASAIEIFQQIADSGY